MANIEATRTPVDLIEGSAGAELSSTNTSLSFERTRLSADRTLMAIVRTALALIGFGFTIFKVFNELSQKGVLPDADLMARRLGVALLGLGVLLLVLGIAAHMRFFRQLTARRERLFELHLLHHQREYRATPTFVIAFLLLLVGLGAFVSTLFRLFG